MGPPCTRPFDYIEMLSVVGSTRIVRGAESIAGIGPPDKRQAVIVLGERERAVKLPVSTGGYEPVGSRPSRIAPRGKNVAPTGQERHD